MSRPLKVAILGYGKIARDAHGPAWQRAAARGGVVVSTVYEPSARGCDAASEAFPGADVVRADARSALEEPVAVDVVDICTPGDLHYELVMGALQQGRHVLVEKPLAHSATEVESIIHSQQGAVVQVCQTFRFGKPVQQFRSAVAAGSIGRITRIQLVHHARHILSEAEWVTRDRADGAIFENAIHFLDLVHYLLAAEVPIRIEASRFKETPHRPVVTGFEMLASDAFGREVTVDFLQDSLRHSALLSHVYVSGTGADAELRFYPDGFRLLSGVVDPLHDLSASLRRLLVVGRRLLPLAPTRPPHELLIDNLLNSIRNGGQLLCDPASVAPGVATAEALATTWYASTVR